MSKKPFISVIVPVYNGATHIGQCLDVLVKSSYQSYEIIVVDDASTDDTAEMARKKGVAVLQMEHQSGPAAARNYAAQKARGEILFFIDSDVVAQCDTLARVASDFEKNPDIAAVFG